MINECVNNQLKVHTLLYLKRFGEEAKWTMKIFSGIRCIQWELRLVEVVLLDLETFLEIFAFEEFVKAI